MSQYVGHTVRFNIEDQIVLKMLTIHPYDVFFRSLIIVTMTRKQVPVYENFDGRQQLITFSRESPF